MGKLPNDLYSIILNFFFGKCDICKKKKEYFDIQKYYLYYYKTVFDDDYYFNEPVKILKLCNKCKNTKIKNYIIKNFNEF